MDTVAFAGVMWVVGFCTGGLFVFAWHEMKESVRLLAEIERDVEALRQTRESVKKGLADIVTRQGG
jgi:precorrin-6B methylase 2